MKHTMKTDLVEIRFDVELCDEPYISQTEIVVATIEKALSKASREDWRFIEGKIIVEFHDGHAGITNEMKHWVAMLKEQLCGLGVEMRGSGVSACERMGKNIARISFKCALHWEFDYKTMENVWP